MKSDVHSMRKRIDLNLLVVFDAIYRSHNLTAAGQELGLSQPSMSRALGQLRRIFKDPLFVRLPHGMEPTPLADELAPALVEGLAIIRGSFERKTFDPLTSTRLFAIGMADIGEVVHLPHLFKQARSTAPHVRFRTVEMSGQRVGEALGNGEVDLAIGFQYRLGAGCREKRLYKARYACVARAGHPHIRYPLTLAMFREAEHILVKPRHPSIHGGIVEHALRDAGAEGNIALEVSSFHGIGTLVSSSDLVATVPSRLAEALARQGQIKAYPPPIPLPEIEISLYWHERFNRDPANIWLRNLYSRLCQDW